MKNEIPKEKYPGREVFLTSAEVFVDLQLSLDASIGTFSMDISTILSCKYLDSKFHFLR